MDLLFFLQIFVAAVNAGKVILNEEAGNGTYTEPHEEGEDVEKRDAPHNLIFGAQHGSYSAPDPLPLYNAPQHGSYSAPDPLPLYKAPQPVYDCFITIPVVWSSVTATKTKLWLETTTYTSFLLSAAVPTVYITNTVIRTTARVDIEYPLTITAIPLVENVWESITNTHTKVWEKFFTNSIPATTTYTKYTLATEVPVVCSTRTVEGPSIYITETTTWTHTQTMHEKVMVTTVWDVTVTITDHQGHIEADRSTEHYYVTRTVVETEFDMITQYTASTLWVTDVVKESCYSG